MLETSPTLTLQTSGKVDVNTSVTLTCGVEYRWDDGAQYHGSHCAHQESPLHLTSDSGIDATATGELEESVSLDDIVRVDGVDRGRGPRRLPSRRAAGDRTRCRSRLRPRRLPRLLLEGKPGPRHDRPGHPIPGDALHLRRRAATP